MTRAAVGFLVFLAGTPAFAQRPSDPALLVPQNAPVLDYVAAPVPVTLPAGVTMGASASVAFDARGHLFVLTRGPQPVFEFDDNGKFIRTFGERLFTRSHGLRIDRDGSLWTTDVGAHVVMKMNPQGQVLLTLGTKGEAGENWLMLRDVSHPDRLDGAQLRPNKGAEKRWLVPVSLDNP